MLKSEDIVVIGAARTPMGNFGGTLKDLKCYDLGKEVIRGVLEKSSLSAEQIDYVAGGNTRQAGNGPNPARTAALKAGIGTDVHAVTINNACPSSMKAAIMAAQNVMLGESNAVIVLGMESMSTIPFLIHGIRWTGIRFGVESITTMRYSGLRSQTHRGQMSRFSSATVMSNMEEEPWNSTQPS